MRERDRGSFEEWARARQQQLVRRAYLVTGDHHRAEDLVQEALVGVAMRWDTLRDGDPDAAKGACAQRAAVMARILVAELVRRGVLRPSALEQPDGPR